MIRDYESTDMVFIRGLWEGSELPKNCLPDTSDPLFVVRRVVIDDSGRIAMAAFLRLSSEPYLLLDKELGTPETRFEMLQELLDDVCQKARECGLEQLTAWVPPELEKSFGRRLEQLNFVRSPWASYTLNL